MTYLDHNATTPLDERVLEAMLPYMRESFANPSGVYSLAREARQAIETAREQVAALVNAHPSQVVFTSGGTEANNLALKGAVTGCGYRNLYYGATEHPSVRDVARYLHDRDLAVAQPLMVDEAGIVDPVVLEYVTEASSLVSVMWANNETGVINPVAELARQLKERNIPLHTDAVQAVGKIPVDFSASDVSLMTLSSHKIYGPKGVGALVVDKSLDLAPLLHGGGQEKGRRSGTENVAGIVGFGGAANLAQMQLEDYRRNTQRLRESLEAGLKGIDGLQVFAQQAPRIPNTLFFSIPGIDGEALLMQLDTMGFAVASGSACSSKSGKASHVLLAMGVEEQLARGAVRVSLGKDTSSDDVQNFLTTLSRLVNELKNLSVIASR